MSLVQLSLLPKHVCHTGAKTCLSHWCQNMSVTGAAVTDAKTCLSHWCRNMTVTLMIKYVFHSAVTGSKASFSLCCQSMSVTLVPKCVCHSALVQNLYFTLVQKHVCHSGTKAFLPLVPNYLSYQTFFWIPLLYSEVICISTYCIICTNAVIQKWNKV